MSWAATVFRVCAWRYAWLWCLWAAVGPAGPGCGACGRRWGLAGILPATRACRCGGHPEQQWAPSGRRWGLAGLRDRSLRAKLVCGDLAGGPPPTGATGRIKWAGLASPGSVVAKISRGSEVAKVPSEARGADGERAGRPRAAWKYGGEAAERKRGRRDSASGGVEVEEGY